MFSWDLEPKWQKHHFFLRQQGSCSLEPERHAHGFVFLFLPTTALLKYLHFSENTRLLSHARKSGDSTILHTQGSNRYGRSPHRIIVPELFSKAMLECVPGVSLHSSEAVGGNISLNLELRAVRQSSISPNEHGRLAMSKLMEERT